MFPNAEIGVFNIPPREYSQGSVIVDRLFTFNNFLADSVAIMYKNVSLIGLFWELINIDGYQDSRYFHRDFLHLSIQGVALLTEFVSIFQYRVLNKPN